MAVDEEAEAVFREGVAKFEEGAYVDAARRFDQVIREYPASHRTTAAYVMKGKALLRAGKNLQTARTIRSFMERYPASSYRPDAHLILGAVFERVGRYEDAIKEYRSAWNALSTPPLPKLFRLVVAALDSVIDHYVPVRTVRTVLETSEDTDQRAYFWLKVGEKEVGLQNIVAASIVYDTLINYYPANPFGARVAALGRSIGLRKTLKIGVLLPLMEKGDPSAVQRLGNEVLEGITYTVDEYERDPGTRVHVSLEVRDSKRDAAASAGAVEELAADPDVVGILGPVFSSTTSSAAVSAQEKGIPLISPTANANGLAARGNMIFQVNPDYETRGRAMARFAVLRKGFTTLAVLAPRDTYGRLLAEAFMREAKRLEANVIATEWYTDGTSDFKSQLASIRKAGMLHSAEPLLAFGGTLKRSDVMKFMSLGIPLRRLDSLMGAGTTIEAKTLLGPDARAILDSLQIPAEYDLTQIDSLEFPVTSIEGIYVPISSPAEIGVVSSQIVYFHFQTQLLGSGEWGDIAELDANKRYCDGVIFESDTFVDLESESYKTFLAGFTRQFGKPPGRNVLYGVDAARLVLEGIRGGAGTRPALALSLAETRDFRGLRSQIGFSYRRVNSWLTILQFSEERLQRLEEISVP
jgi:ABC-type branched-subunit amino acid transport system substrate-binding protein